MPAPQEYRSVSFNLLLPSMRPLSVDEKCWSIYERDEFSADYKEVRRIQTVRVHRGDRLVEFSKDIGAGSRFAAAPFAIACLDEHSVGKALEMADWQRKYSPGLLADAIAQHQEVEGNVIERALERAEQMKTFLERNHRTALVKKTRNRNR